MACREQFPGQRSNLFLLGAHARPVQIADEQKSTMQQYTDVLKNRYILD